MHQIKDSRPAGQPDRGGAERKLVMITEPEALHPDPGHYNARGDDRYFGGRTRLTTTEPVPDVD
jgi:hypothetical protein